MILRDTQATVDTSHIIFHFAGWFAIPKTQGYSDLFFLHEMYECIEKYYNSCLPEFVEKCDSLKMKVYIDEYLSHKN